MRKKKDIPSTAWQLAPPFIYSSICFFLLLQILSAVHIAANVLVDAREGGETAPALLLYLLVVLIILSVFVVFYSFYLNTERLVCGDDKCGDECGHHKLVLIRLMRAMFILFLIGILYWGFFQYYTK